MKDSHARRSTPAPAPWRITIDNTFLMSHPWHLLPLFVGAQVRSLGAIKGWSIGIGSLPRWAFRPDAYDGIELSLTTSQVFGSNVGRRWRIRTGLIERYRASGWPIAAFHACFEHPPPYFEHAKLDLTGDDPRVREGAVGQVEVAAMLGGAGAPPGSGGPVLVFHTGRAPAGASRRDRRAALRRVAANLRPAVRLAESSGVTVTLENLPRSMGASEHFCSRRIEDVIEVLADIGSAGVGVTFDYGHANTFCDEDPEYIDRFLDRLGPHIEYVHLHYNGSHRPGFAATVDPRRFEGFDQHLPLTRIPAAEMPRFAGHLRKIVTSTPVARRRLVGLELPQRSVFSIKRILPTGATPQEQAESARIVRRMLEEIGA
ncbi:MAG: TIM barrel protein [Myxococcota bacterium]|nr:TIM barrel protein [Myxococcota bacterium]